MTQQSALSYSVAQLASEIELIDGALQLSDANFRQQKLRISALPGETARTYAAHVLALGQKVAQRNMKAGVPLIAQLCVLAQMATECAAKKMKP